MGYNLFVIRKAEQKDLSRIFEIYNKVKLDRNKLGDSVYETSVQKNGFLLGLDTSENISKQIDEAYDFVVYEENEKILGSLLADHRDEQKFYDDEYKTWFFPELKDYYYHDPKAMTLATIAVDPQHTGKGVATELLKYLENRLKSEDFEYLFSIITLAPLTNCPTTLWHSKNGFKRFAMGRPRRLFDLDNYSAVLLFKKL